MIVANGINLTIAIILIICIVACAHYLSKIFAILKDLCDVQKKVAEKLGAITPHDWNKK